VTDETTPRAILAADQERYSGKNEAVLHAREETERLGIVVFLPE
jgi:hypothetical protein